MAKHIARPGSIFTERRMLKMGKEIKKEAIRSEMIHAQEVSIIHSAPPEELIE